MPTARNTESTSALTSALATAGVTAALLLGGTAATAEPAATAGPVGQATHSACNRHGVDGHSAEVCRTWTPVGSGYYFVTWEVRSASAGVVAQGRFDGRVVDLGLSGNRNNVEDFVTRACFGKRCSSWA